MMFKATLKKQALIMSAATLALTASANSLAGLVTNGDFETFGGTSWGVETGGGASFSFPTTGGNPDGYLRMDNTSAAWGGVAISTDDTAGTPLATVSAATGVTLTAGSSYDFLWDMKAFSGAGGGSGIKIESWNDAGFLSTTGDQVFAATSGWSSYSYNYLIDAGATRLIIVLLGVNADSVMGYDNVCIESCVSAVPVPAAVWLFGSGLLGLVGVARKKKA
jgi:hypothetical protein